MTTTIHVQDAITGRFDVVIDRIEAAFTSLPQFSSVEVAVAYASVQGVELFVARASRASSWRRSPKRFLVSIDSGFTEPDALVRLAAIPNSEVRVPNAEAVLARSRLRPIRPFHPKAYLVRDISDVGAAVLLSGSANMTVSAMATGAEVVTQRTWTRGDPSVNPGYGSYSTWFEEAWRIASPLSLVIDRYRAKRPAAQRHLPGPEDQDPASLAYLPPAGQPVAVSGATGARLAVAKAFWIEASISPNRGRLPGNQLDMQRGARVFFGFSPSTVPRNHIFGDILIRFGAGAYQPHSVRYGNNQMDKVNLPLPGQDGPATYAGGILLFQRDSSTSTGVSRFTLNLVSRRALNNLSRSAAGTFETAMLGGRRWGVLF